MLIKLFSFIAIKTKTNLIVFIKYLPVDSF